MRRTKISSNDITAAVAALNADVFFVSAELSRDTADRLRACHDQRSHKDCVLILTTEGGDPGAAYIMARFLRDGHPNGFKALVLGRCKSAGTLLALGAREIVMGRRGELGPLDIQVSEKDEPFRLASGLELFTTLSSLAQNTFTTFETYLLQLIQRSAGQLSMKAAAKIATELTVGIMSPLSQQIDPLQLGRRERALNIVKAYAERLEVQDAVIAKLATGYPDHGFVIDFTEAKKAPAGDSPRSERCGDENGKSTGRAIERTRSLRPAALPRRDHRTIERRTEPERGGNRWRRTGASKRFGRKTTGSGWQTHERRR